LKAAYCDGVTWESHDGLDRRAAKLLAALLLARIDGKSPVEYLTEEQSKGFVRAQAKAFLRSDALSLDAIVGTWTVALTAL
jgi:hypothetical protein